MIETKSSKTISTCSNKFPLVTVKSVRIIFKAPPMMMDTKNLIDMKNLITWCGRTFTFFLSQKCLKDENHTHRHILDWKYLLPSLNCTRWLQSYKLTNNKMFYSCKILKDEPECTKISRGVLPSGLNKALVHVLAGNYFRQIQYSKLS